MFDLRASRLVPILSPAPACRKRPQAALAEAAVLQFPPEVVVHAMNTIGPVLITGATGMLGSALTALCTELGVPFEAYAEAELDITDTSALDAVVARFARRAAAGAGAAHTTVINAAAYTDVEKAEDEEERAYAVNDRAARNVAESAARHGLGLVHVSTDFVFDGTKDEPYVEEDQTRPLNAYGRSKLAGERSAVEAHPKALVVRTAWVFGPAGANFPVKILDLAGSHDDLQVVDDEFGTPTATPDLARGILGLIQLAATGLYHLAGFGSCSRYELAHEVLGAAGLQTRLVPVKRGFFVYKADRPANSALSSEKARRLGVVMPPWQPSLRAFVQQRMAPDRGDDVR
jgi:dTDP-4-dehydrorhamnose reductase